MRSINVPFCVSLCMCVSVCECVPTEQRERLESTCPTHTQKTETVQVCISLILQLFHLILPSSCVAHLFFLLIIILFIFFSFGVGLSAHLLCETLAGPDPESPVGSNNNHLHHLVDNLGKPSLAPPPSVTVSNQPSRLSLERSFSVEEEQQKCVVCPLQPARVYTITSQLMSGGRGSKESLELDVLKEKSGGRGMGSRGLIQPSTSPSSTSSSPTQHQQASSSRGTGHHHHCNHHHGNHHHAVSASTAPSNSSGAGGSSSNQQLSGCHGHHASHHGHHHHLSQPPLQTSVSAHNIRTWSESGKGEADCGGLACESCSGAPSRSQGSLDLESSTREAGKQHRHLVRMWSVDRATGLERGERGRMEDGGGTEVGSNWDFILDQRGNNQVTGGLSCAV